MRLIAKVIRISHAKFQCNGFTTVQDIQDYASLIFWDTVYISIANIIAPSLPNLNYTLHIGSAENTSKKVMM